ncbi:glutamine--fructose-6-phosphate transaminase (isomerizing) [Tepidibacillus fermentans]|uniref:Glutamine--fructose-6-phosphate aminotransferase [isomerizing] n=1 Tax=Tepidibacillus fermentans TaxID=1281767 RepID=A0A4R3K734_9BACI|nr:glutamine--fructose-6-phosphate transaminase (isomerizing) [Tepidibacillus fermentans]TCS78637.1 glucosamine--fructose-6-phosphate aminotransferase (isomerizing) [Tepidibacillus fermentans]
MCGIVGYIGQREAQPILINGLKKLEYRGYDSAGIAVYENGEIRLEKSVGRLSNLEKKLEKSPMKGSIGIGHTRWATHGRPSDMNSHPHMDERQQFAVVHNGIIENFLEIKEELLKKGVTFKSETDTEVIAHLLADLYDGDLVSTVQKAVARMEGAYALGIININEPDKLVAVRLASPLVVGLGENENFIASDIPALIEHTRDVYILNDGEMAVITADRVQLMSTTGELIERTPFHVEWDVETADKGGYDHYMLKEIHEQPRAYRETLNNRIDHENQRVDLSKEIHLSEDEIRAIEKIHIVACGTAYHAGLVGKYVIENLVRIPVEVDVASEYRYRNPIITPNTLVMVISQSGETADTLAALREAQKLGAKVLAITNVNGSSVARDADEVLLTHAGPEIAVASTKAYTAQLITIYLWGLYLAQIRETQSEEVIRQYIQALSQLPTQVEKLLEFAPTMKQFAERYAHYEDLFFIGRSLDYAVSLEGSLKLKEISYIHSEAYPAGELKHGTLALITNDVPVIALATQEDVYEKMVSNIKEVNAREAYILGITLEGNEEGLSKSVNEVIAIPRTLPLLTPALSVIPLQLLAYYAALARGNDVDKPRNLAKSVTVE